jgi:D-cysteine desulfhydrase
LPVAALAELPTPVSVSEDLGRAVGCGPVWVKRDDACAPGYGGNKVRKLAFLLGRAQADGVKTVLTYGAAGSNHALATAIHARRLGLGTVALLVPQHNSASVGKNLLHHLEAGTDLRPCANGRAAAVETVRAFYQAARADGRFPQVIPPGGSSPLGLAGFVDAAFELKAQVEAGLLPAPTRVYAASGTMGTVVGLTLGFAAAGLDCTTVAVRVTWEKFTSLAKARRLFHTTNHLLREADPSFPLLDFPEDRFELRDEFFGEDYGLWTPAGVEAMDLAGELAGLRLEGTYTGKAMAGLLADARCGRLGKQTALFWNTYNSVPWTPAAGAGDPARLPVAFQPYFTGELQPLERKQVIS